MNEIFYSKVYKWSHNHELDFKMSSMRASSDRCFFSWLVVASAHI